MPNKQGDNPLDESRPGDGDPRELLRLARDGDARALGRLLEGYRPYLRILAQRELDRRVQARVDASDIVQQTFLEAQRDLPQFEGESAAELAAWLRTVLAHNVGQTIQRHLKTKKRSAHKETRLETPSGDGGMKLVPSEQSTPSQRVMRGEAAIALAQALELLPEDQREAIRLRHLEGLPLVEIARHFDRSEVAVAGLVKRGLRKLREILDLSEDPRP